MKEIGQRLQAARQAQGITLDAAEEATRIRQKYLDALERGLEAELPGEAYLKGFLRTYGNYLGLDGPGLVEEYKARKAAPADGVAPPLTQVAVSAQKPVERHVEQPAAKPAAPVPPVVARPAAKDVPPRPERSIANQFQPRRQKTPWVYSRQAGRALVIVVVLGVVGYGGWLIWRQASVPKAATPPLVQTPPAPAPTPAPTPTPAPPPAPAAVVTTMTKGTGENVNFAVGAKDVDVQLEVGSVKVWMEAFVDGKEVPVANGGYPSGTLEFKGNNIRLHMGHMEGISLVVNGQRFDNPLQAGPYWLNFQGQ